MHALTILILGQACWLGERSSSPTPPPAPAPAAAPIPAEPSAPKASAPATPALALRAAQGKIRASQFAAGAEAIEASLRPSVHMISSRSTIEAIPVGASHFGGQPDLPAGFVWPRYKGVPLTLLAQIRLADTVPYDVEDKLPDSGWLYVFYEMSAFTWGLEASEKGSWVLRYHDGPVEGLNRAPLPSDLPEEASWQNPASLRFAPSIDLPSYDDRRFPGATVGESDEAWEAWFDFAASFAPDQNGEVYNHLLGHPQIIQNEMRIPTEITFSVPLQPEARLAAWSDPAVQARADGWNLLLQLDSDEAGPGWMWGDVGRLYFWIRDEDLAARRFDDVWMHLQCY